MKIIYHLKRLSVVLIMMASMISCNDFFRTPIMETLNQDSIFKSMYNAEKALNAAYYLIPYNWPTRYQSSEGGYRNDAKIFQDIIATICDEAVSSGNWTGAKKGYYGDGTINPLSVGQGAAESDRAIVEHIFEEPYYYFRRAFLFLEGVDRVPDATSEWLASTKAQANLLIAIGYYELIRRYGSVPWVDKALTINDDLSEERLPLNELIVKVDDLIKKSIDGLPDRIDESDPNYGRVTKATAYFLRSRLWLLAASPLFNTDVPYMPYDHPEYICLMNSTEESRREVWGKAVQYSLDAITFCENHGYSLMKGTDMSDYDDLSDVYHRATRDLIGNTEVIQFSRRISNANAKSTTNTFFGHNMPPRANGVSGKSAFCAITQNLVDMYKTVDGSEPNYNTSNPWEKLDPRFHATVIYDQSTFGGSSPIGTSDGDPWITPNPATGWMTGYYLKKFFHEDQYINNSLNKDMPYIYMRLPELYLNYAEALNEYSPGDSNIEIYLNKTTERVGMPHINLDGLSPDEVRNEIRRERAVELAIEDQRFFDVKRWKIADSTIGGVKYGVVRIGKATDSNRRYEKRPCPDSRQTNWHDKYYLMPFPQYEILKESGLVQNPGY